MAENDGSLDILFGVSGGENIDGESGLKIAKQLNKLAKKLDLNIVASIDEAGTTEKINKQLKKIQGNLVLKIPKPDENNTKKQYESAAKQLEGALTQLMKMSSDKGLSQTLLADKTLIADFSKTCRDNKSAIEGLRIGDTFKIDSTNFRQATEYLNKFREIQQQYTRLKDTHQNNVYLENKGLTEQKVLDTATKYMQKYGTTLSKNAPGSYTQLADLIKSLNEGAYSANPGQAQKLFLEIAGNARIAGGETESLRQKVSRLFSEKFGIGALAALAIGARQALAQVYKNVVNIDTAMTELKKVTDESDESYSKFLDNAANRAKKLGATMTDVITASADFARLGYDMPAASSLADASIVYKNVGDGISDISTASESIISTMRAFNIDAKNAMTIVDKYNEVGNRFAISSKGVGDVLLRSASALQTAGNTLDEAIALGTGANSIIQDPEKVGTAVKTISMYLRSSKADLENAGESVEGMVESTPKLQKLLKRVAGVDILQADGTTLKSTYQILKELSLVWDNLTDVNKASVLEAIGGKRNSNVTSAIIKNFSEIEKVLAVSQNSSGSALAENEKYLDSVNGKIAQLKAQFEDISRSVLSSDILKMLADIVQKILEGANGLAKAKMLLPVIFSIIATNKGLLFGTDKAGDVTILGKTKATRQSTKALGKWLGEGTRFGFKSVKSLNLTAGDIDLLRQYNALLVGGGTVSEEFAKRLNESNATVKKLSVGLHDGAISMEAIEAATTQATTAMQIFNTLKAAAGNLIVSAIISLASWGLQEWAKTLPTVENLSQKLTDIKNDLNSLESEASSLNEELETTKQKIAELEGKESLSLVEENELKQLKQTNAELSAQLALNKAIAKEKQAAQNSTFVKWAAAQDTDIGKRQFFAVHKSNVLYDAKEYGTSNIKNQNLRDKRSANLEEWFANTEEAIEILKAKYEEASNAGDTKLAEKYKAAADKMSEEHGNKFSEIKEQVDGLSYIESPTTEDEKKVNELLDLYKVISARSLKFSGDIKGAWEQIAAIPRFGDIRDELTELGKSGEISAGKLLTLWNSSSEFGNFIEMLGKANLVPWEEILGKDLFKELDATNDGLVSYDEMVKFASTHSEEFSKVLLSVANSFGNVADKTDEATEKLSPYLESIKSLSGKFKNIEEKKSDISEILAEIRDDGSISDKSMADILTDFKNVEGFEDYIKVLTSGKSTAKELQDALNGLYSAYIDGQNIVEDVTDDTYAYTVARLKANGVTNASEVASIALANSLTKEAIANKDLNDATVTRVANLLTESGVSEKVAEQYLDAARAVVSAQNSMTNALSEQTKMRLKDMNLELSAIKNYATAQEAILQAARRASASKKPQGGAAFRNAENLYGTDVAIRSVFDDQTRAELEAYFTQAKTASKAQAEIDALIKKISLGGGSASAKTTAKGSSSKSSADAYKDAFDDWYTRLKWQRDNNIISETKFLQTLDAKYRSYYGGKKKYLEQYAKYSQEVYEGFKKLYQNDLNAQKDALEKQKSDLKDLADARKKALEDKDDEAEYKKDQTEKREEINKLKVLIASFRGTLSLSSQKKLRELQKELKEKEEELADFEKDKALDRAKDQIDKDYEAQEKSIDAKIKSIEDILDKISDDVPAIRAAVISFAKKYGVPVTRAYASGTSSVPSVTQENGAEVIAGNVRRGQFTMLTPSSKVWNASATQALWEFANSPEAFVGTVMEKIASFKNRASSVIYAQPVNVTVGDIVVNGNADKKAVQEIKDSQREQIEEILNCFKKTQ